MNTIRKWLDRSIEAFGCLMLVLMVLAVCWQVVSRYIFNSPSTMTEELLRFSLVWISVIGMAYVAGRKEHISLTLFLDKCPARWTRVWHLIIQLVFILFAIYVMIMGGWKISANAMVQVSPVLRLSMGHVYFALPISGVLIIVYSLLNIADLFSQPASVTTGQDADRLQQGVQQYD
ncbi:TRAP-type C4-dicarboxylate transport system, small permease component [Aeromonas sp. RU39B]|jgi:TRAP-type C4-dicarboxylate transport system permease small subunit|uniref:TRAP transporter small permease n=1 Tax=Aeromonas sp. RU39B TaxID=1907416 RepID=UPI0009568E41|nr:TRAP transporter small permease [Aeromonas sp. RU39B]SIR21301.1 TRAP-type C4-dicarboxylate transport system, small permease component [Aeromonas sp. RU39B]